MHILLSVFINCLFIHSAFGLNLNDIKRMNTLGTTLAPVVNFELVDPGSLLYDCAAGCQSGWKYLNSKCYQKFDVATTFAQAKANCESVGATLATVDSADENDALRKEYDSNVVVGEPKQTWIGLKLTAGVWQWQDGTSISFTNWAPTEPATGQCVQMITDTMKKAAYKYERGGWKTYACAQTSSSYICEKPASAQ